MCRLCNIYKYGYSYEKVEHKEEIEAQVDLLRDALVPLLTRLNWTRAGVVEVDGQRANAEY